MTAKPIFRLISSIVLAVPTIYGTLAFLDWRIEHVVTKTDFIQKVAREVRPYVVFDENGSILYDGGAMEYLKDISLDYSDEILAKMKGSPVFHLTISPARFLNTPPILESLKNIKISYEASRGKKYDIVYTINIDEYQSVNDKPVRPFVFRLEILN